MAAAARRIFRERSLERAASPARLDELLRVVGPRSWLALTVAALALGGVLVWGLLGRVPITVEGQALLLRPRQVVAFQAPVEGRVAEVAVHVGDRVAEGQVLARMALPDLTKELEQQRANLTSLEERHRELGALEAEQAELERSLLAEQRELLERRVKSLTATAEAARQRSEELIAQQRSNLETARRLSQELEAALEERQKSFSLLEGQGLIARDQLVEARSRTIDEQLGLAELAVLEQELRMREQQARDAYERQLDQVVDLGLQSKDLERRELEVDLELRRNELSRAAERQAVERRIEQLDARIAAEGDVRAEYDGRVLEVAMLVGQRVELGSRLGRLEIEGGDARVMALCYFDVEDGKRVRPGLELLVSPSTTPRERFGSILGRVARVSDLPVTVEAAANQVGDLDLARALVVGPGRIEVLAELVADADAPTGYAWTSGRGPRELSVTSGTTASARVVIDRRAPITFVLPFLRSLGAP